MFKKVRLRLIERKMKLPNGTIVNILKGDEDEVELRGYVKDGRVIWK